MAIDAQQQSISQKRFQGIAKNEFLGQPAQFQYSRNIDITSDPSCIQLVAKSEIEEQSNITGMWPWDRINFMLWKDFNNFIAFGTGQQLWTCSNNSFPTFNLQAITNITISLATMFKDGTGEKIFWFGTWAVEIINPSTYWWVTTTPTDWSYTYSRAECVYKYSNSVLLVWDGNLLRRYVPVWSAELPVWWKVVREFDPSDRIVAITQTGNTLKLYVVKDFLNTRIVYVNGTFDVEDWGTVENIWRDNVQVTKVTTFNNIDHVTLRSWWDNDIWYLYAVDGYRRELIMESKDNNWQSDWLEFFDRWSDFNWQDPSKREYLYLLRWDGIWKYGINDSGALSLNLERERESLLSGWWYDFAYIHGSYLYVWFAYNFNDYRIVRYYLDYRNEWYTNKIWYLFSSINVGTQFWTRKQSLRCAIAYEIDNANWWDIRLYYRKNREGKNFGSWWNFLKTINDHTKMYDIIDLPYNSLSWEWVKFDYNCFEYKIELRKWSDDLVSPRVYEISRFYNDNDFQNS